jgi:hypothetical protein
MKSSNSRPFSAPGITSRFVKGRSAAELPISRQSSTQATAAFRSSGWESVLASIWISSSALGPVRRMRPLLLGRTTPPNKVQQACGGLNFAAQRSFHQAGLQIGSVEVGIALPEKRCFTAIVARSEGLLILPDAADTMMILKVLPNTWKMLDKRYAQAL